MALPDFSFENKLHKLGYKLIAGVDEVGRGSFAGPVVAGAVILNNQIYKSANLQIKINDSKKLSKKQREVADKWIRKNAIAFGIGQASVAQINKFGIKKATEIAFRKAIKNCGIRIDYLLIDAFYIPYVKGLRRKNQKAIIKGDSKSVSIAAASIIAKVYRDDLMTRLSKQSKYKKYSWHKNMGYGTKDHRNAIQKYGATKLHRKLFVRNCVSSQVE
ncbi:MAG TPA: ribonuclease HII [Patescibacteria group bacterium]|nr:ribonuclease HII [Patescibacteria group bacterium]